MADNNQDKFGKNFVDRKNQFSYTTGPLGGTTFDNSTLKQLTGINSNKAIELREKILEHNRAIKDKKDGTIPLVLIPKHELRIYRHVKEYDPETGYLRHNAVDGSSDKESLKAAAAIQAAQNMTADAASFLADKIAAATGDSYVKKSVKKAVDSIKKQMHEADIKYFPIEPKDGMSDFVGIKFEYTYEKEITNFTLTFNNEHGKNKERFMSGDVIEFYFDLVPEEVIVALERNNFHVKKEDIKMELPLVFTGILEEISMGNSTDAHTVDWSGRNGAYILGNRNVNYVYPNNTETLQTNANTMSYEEIIWNLIVFGTGMVVGEVDLGNRQKFYYLGTPGPETIDALNEKSGVINTATEAGGTASNFSSATDVDTNTLDLMNVEGINASVGTRNKSSNWVKFKEGLEDVLKKHPFCHTIEADGSKKARWSSLLEFDLMKPKIFSMAELETGGAGAGASGDGLGQGLVGSYIYGSETSLDDIPPSVRFKTAWGRDVFAYHYRIMKQNYEAILQNAPIKTETYADNGLMVRAILLDQDFLNNAGASSVSARQLSPGWWGRTFGSSVDENMRTVLNHVYTKLYNQLTLNQGQALDYDKEFEDWIKEVVKVYENNKSTKSSILYHPANEQFEATGNESSPNTVLGATSLNRDSSTMALVTQNPAVPPNVGSVLLVPFPQLKKYNYLIAEFYPPTGNFKTTGSEGINMVENISSGAILSVRTVSLWKKDDEIQISIIESAGSRTQSTSTVSKLIRINFYVDIKVTIVKSTTQGVGGATVVVDQKKVPNNITTIAAILDNSGILTATIGKDAINNPQQIMGLPGTEDAVGKRDGGPSGGPVTMVEDKTDGNAGAQKKSTTFEAQGKVLDMVRKALDKFFACILYVDEFNIAHIRPRYKNLQLDGDPNAPPIWGLYSGHPVYPRLFKSDWKDKLKITPNSVLVIGESTTKATPHIFAKANHGLLQGRFGEYQVVDDNSNEGFSSKFEAYNCAKNRLLSYIRSGYQASADCDIIPALRPGHRLDIVDTVTNMIGGFLIENIQWSYAKHEGMKMSLGLSSQMLVADDTFTTTAIASESALADGFLARNFNGGYENGGHDERQTGFLNNLFKTNNIDLQKASTSGEVDIEDETINKQLDIFNNREALLFDIDKNGKTIANARLGFEKIPNPENHKE